MNWREASQRPRPSEGEAPSREALALRLAAARRDAAARLPEAPGTARFKAARWILPSFFAALKTEWKNCAPLSGLGQLNLACPKTTFRYHLAAAARPPTASSAGRRMPDLLRVLSNGPPADIAAPLVNSSRQDSKAIAMVTMESALTILLVSGRVSIAVMRVTM